MSDTDRDVDALIAEVADRPEPGTGQPRDQLIWQFATQARACRAMGSELYPQLLGRAIAELEAGGPTWRLVGPHVAPGRGNAIALRLMAAVHRLVLTGRAPSLAPFYAACGGEADPATAWPAFRAVVEEHEPNLVPLVELGCQTNEPGRAASLAVGFLDVAGRTGLPLDVTEIGAAAGLNLQWDRFHYAGGGQEWGDPTSPVDLAGTWVDPPAVDHVRTEVVRRTGVDRAPIDPTTDEGWLTLASSIWGDQATRFARLRGAIDLTRRAPPEILTADAVEWVEDHLVPQAGRTTVLAQSVLREYLDDEAGGRLEAAVAAAGARASAGAPLAWVRLEPISLQRRHGLSVVLWPGGELRELTTAGSLGSDVRQVTTA